MFESLKRLLASGEEGADWRAMAAWASQRGAQFKRSRDGAGFIVEGRHDGLDWRLEWGPPQRNYIAGHELRLRMALGVAPDLNLLLISRPLMETLESRAFEQYTAQMQTRIDDTMPEEMRWLAMFAKVPIAADKELRQRFGLVAVSPAPAQVWLQGAMVEELAHAARGALSAEPPFVLMTLRGRLYLRLELAEPDVAAVDAMLRLFEAAATRALLAAGGTTDRPESGPSTTTTAWQTQFSPNDVQR